MSPSLQYPQKLMFHWITLGVLFIVLNLKPTHEKESFKKIAAQLKQEESKYRNLKDGEEFGYCSRRHVKCCPGRDDQCTMPMLDTLCYCDIFCDRNISDCCPDFEDVCFGGKNGDHGNKNGGLNGQNGGAQDQTSNGDQSSQSSENDNIKNNCYYNGILYQPDDEIKINCNNCSCVHAIVSEEYNWKCTQKTCLIRPEIIEHVNAAQHGWRAVNYSSLWGLTFDDGVKYKLGTFHPSKHITQLSQIRVKVDEELPETFDARQKWPGLIVPPADQGNCASSWAFSTIGVVTDRLHIHSNGAHMDNLSPQHLISCNDDRQQKGCDSGHVDRAWWFIRKTGVVDEQCYPYTSGAAMDAGKCLLQGPQLKTGSVNCPDGRSQPRVYHASPPYKIQPNEKEIMTELIENGPLQATMIVKEDFFVYKSGVYHHSMAADYEPESAKEKHYHSVRLIGWGVDNSSGKPLKYWLCANSWGTGWGEDGHFKILRGADECKIESYIVGAWIKVNDRVLVKKRGNGGSGKLVNAF